MDAPCRLPSPPLAAEGLCGGPGCDEAALFFSGVEVLAPMVRASRLPMRLECLRYGAGLVYGEEVIDRKIIGALRVENKAFDTIDYVCPVGKIDVFSTCREERSRVIFQLGTADSVLASQAAEVVCRDVRGLDVNMGCPKSFSVKGGMGAALLRSPSVAADILKGLRRTLPSSCALSCKIRMLPTTEQTRDFMQLCERSGAEAITVHLRQTGERPADPAHWDEMTRLWDAVRIPVLANGDFFTRRQIDEFWKHCRGSQELEKARGPTGVMVARGALWNPSIFARDSAVDFDDVVRGYTRAAVRTNNSYQNTKWVLASMLAGGTGVSTPREFRGLPIKEFNQQVSRAKSMSGICELLGETFVQGDYPDKAHTTVYYKGLCVEDHLLGDALAGEKRKGGPAEDLHLEAETQQKRPRAESPGSKTPVQEQSEAT